VVAPLLVICWSVAVEAGTPLVIGCPFTMSWLVETLPAEKFVT
jgi:hypothetical protein